MEKKKDLGRVVIIGANGFIGSHFTKLLAAQNVKVLSFAGKALDLTQPSSAQTLESSIKPEDSIVFISALTPDRGRDAATMLKNIDMLKQFIPAIEKTGCSHLTYISSDAVYLDSATLVDEQVPCDPKTFHGIMHITREKILLDMASRKKIPFLRVRPCAVYGTGDTHNSYGPNRFLKLARENSKITLSGQGEEQRDHLYIGDLCRLLYCFIEDRTEGIFNAASGVAYSFDQVAKTVLKVTGSKAQIEYTPRQQPRTDRHFDITSVMRKFPDFHFLSLQEGLAQSV